MTSKDMDFKSTMKKSESSDNYMVVNKEGYIDLCMLEKYAA